MTEPIGPEQPRDLNVEFRKSIESPPHTILAKIRSAYMSSRANSYPDRIVPLLAESARLKTELNKKENHGNQSLLDKQTDNDEEIRKLKRAGAADLTPYDANSPVGMADLVEDLTIAYGRTKNPDVPDSFAQVAEVLRVMIKKKKKIKENIRAKMKEKPKETAAMTEKKEAALAGVS